jgi:hypothetical protein
MGAPHEWSPALTAGRRRCPPDRDGCCQQRVELLQAFVERDQLMAALHQQVLAELVAAEHLQHETAEIAEALFADTKECTTFLAELPWMGKSTPRRARRTSARNRPLILAAEACKQRWPRHANQCNSEV